MPTLPLPANLDSCIDGGDLPVTSITDVANEWAIEIQSVPIAPVRDAIQTGQTDLLLAYQTDASYSAAQSDPGRATDEYLDEILEEYGCPRKMGQTDDQARTVLFSAPPVISPNAVCEIANAVLAPYTVTQCRYAEKSDGWFVCNGEAEWSSHVFASADNGSFNCAPNYIDRPQSYNRGAPGAMPNVDTYGRWFLLRAPDISSLDSELAASYDVAEALIGPSTGSPAIAQAIITNGSLTAVNILQGGTLYSGSTVAVTISAGMGSGAVATGHISGGAVQFVTISNGGSGYAPMQNEPFALTPGLPETSTSVGGFFCGGLGGTGGGSANVTDQNISFVFDFTATTVDAVYNSLISAVNNAVGAGIRWDLVVDSQLVPLPTTPYPTPVASPPA